MKTSIFVPQKICVGYCNRKDTYIGKLAYVVYYDAQGKLRKETSWNNWRDKSIDAQEFSNDPIEGFVINKKVGGYRSYYDVRQTYTRVYDPRGFEFEITIQNLLWILENADCKKGKGLVGQFVYGWDGKDLVLVPVDSPDYKEIKYKADVAFNDSFIKSSDLVVGSTYEKIDGEILVYMGKHPFYATEYNYEKINGNDLYGHSGIYDKPLDVIPKWNHADFELYYGYYSSHRLERSIKQKDRFWFINKKCEDIVSMTSASRKFVRCINSNTSDYQTYLDMLNKCCNYSPVDYDKSGIHDLTFDGFKKMLLSARKEFYYDFYAYNGESYISKFRLRIDADGIYRIEQCSYDGFYKMVTPQNAREIYDMLHPVYGEKILENGSIVGRYGYYE